MYDLSTDLVREIYSYDDTYRVMFNCVVEQLEYKSLNHKRVDMSITREDVILFITIIAIGLYIFIDEHLNKL